MPYEHILYETDNGVAKIVFNRPKALNALHPDLLEEAHAALDQAARDDEVGVVVLTGSGRAFCAGVDLVALGGMNPEHGDVGEVLNGPARAFIDAIIAIPKVVIGMINGFCITGGLELALACDLLVASEEARFADTHAKWGLRCTWGMSARLPRRVGWLKAREMTYTAGMIPAREAERIGLVNQTVPADQLEATVRQLADSILANSRESVAAHKYLYNEGMKRTLGQSIELEFSTPIEISDTAERLAGFAKKG
ncbi:MAG: enoyl-CoA hydratase/isomerase family protein [Proteobacteria bacterium]|nr:enoyl-CoA hydratase/isomerase family protein [Pseudomonadota bacterium]